MGSPTRSALVLGATGLCGGHLVDLLLEHAGFDPVVTLTRRALTRHHPKLRAHVVDFADPTSLTEHLQVDVVFCCLGTTIKKAGSQAAFRAADLELPLALAREARAAGVRQLIVVSSIGANPRSRIFYSRVKGELEAALSGLGFPSLTLLRPSILLGRRAESRPGEAVGQAVLGPLAPLFVGPLRRYRPIAALDVARAMRTLALDPRAGMCVVESDEIWRLAQRGS